MALTFALAGNPNSGKTTLFNDLTGANAHVGNWPGVTIDRKEGKIKHPTEQITLVDLPGIYSLAPYTPEEVVTRNYLLEDAPDLIINIVDSTNLMRNLFLTTQLLELDIPVVVALNMIDASEKQGDKIDVKGLSQLLQVPVVPISALHSKNVKELIDTCVKTAAVPRKGHSLLDETPFAGVLARAQVITLQAKLPQPLFTAVKLLERDKLVLQDARLSTQPHEMEHLTEALNKLPETQGEDQLESILAAQRHGWINAHAEKMLTRARHSAAQSPADKVDKVLMHRVFGPILFLGFMFLMFHLTFAENLFGLEGVPSPGVWLQGLMEELIAWIGGGLEGLLESWGAADWVMGVVINGIVDGVGAVLSFVPQIMLLFFFLAILEDSGYMARAAFMMDRIFRKFGLSGRAFLPMLMGFGCSVPAIMSTRTLETEQDRRLTMLLVPYMSCGAKAPIWAIFAAALFPQNADFVVFGIYLLGILVAVISALILKKTLYKKEASPLIIELPAYRLPKPKSMLVLLWEKLREYVVRAGTIILVSSIAIWFLSSFTFSFEMVETGSAESILGSIGRAISWIFIPLGFGAGVNGWQATVAILTGLLAKEAVVSTMGVLYNPGMGDALEDETASTALKASLASAFTPLTALSFMAFNLLSIPCMAAVAALRAETRSRKWFWLTLGIWLGTAWIVAFLIYQGGRLLGFA